MGVRIDITTAWESAPGVPLEAPVVVPTIRIRRLDTQALVITDVVMVEVGDGMFTYNFNPPVKGIKYSVRANGDPTGVVQVPSTIRYMYGILSNRNDETWAGLGLDPNDNLLIENNAISTPSGDIDQTLSGDGVNNKTIIRTP